MYFKKIYRAYINKITNWLFGFVYMPAETKKKGFVLISYITEPFTLAPWEAFSNFHTMYWECYEIARLFSQRGYASYIVDAKKQKYIPKKKYIVCLDVENNFETYASFLPKNCKKVFHILIPYWRAYNEAEENRLNQLEKRRGMRLMPRRTVSASRDAELADFLEGFGNKTVFNTFSQYKKTPFFIPISAVIKYDFPENKNWEEARKNFLWVGGGGMVLKGLDMTLEAFSTQPDLHLHICGPIYGESDFTEAYKKELTEMPNIHTYGRIDVTDREFREIIKKCGAVVYPSAGEGTSGAIVQAMHAGLIPIITNETGIQEDSGYIPLIDPTPESVSKAIRDFSTMTEVEMRSFSKKIWTYARTHYTREEFSKAYARFVDDVLHL